MSRHETLQLAHTARCKLQIAADRPDRNLRFILGHAFTLDKLMLRVVEIENSESSSDEEDGLSAPLTGSKNPTHPRRVSFSNNAARTPHHLASPSSPSAPRRASPPPPPRGDAQLSDPDTDSDDDDDVFEDDEDDAGLSLQRFASATAQPPRQVPDLVDDEDEDEVEVSEPKSPTEEEVRAVVMKGEENAEVVRLYNNVKRCPCHGKHETGPEVQRAWEVPSGDGESEAEEGRRRVVVQVVEVEG